MLVVGTLPLRHFISQARAGCITAFGIATGVYLVRIQQTLVIPFIKI